MATQGTIGFAIVGAGMVAEYHHRAITANQEEGARLVAVAHYDAQRFAAISASFGAPCQTFPEVLDNPGVTAVCICTPSGQHAEQAIAAAEAGKHVLVEKPMALSLTDADRMIAAATANDVRLGVVLPRRTETLFRRVHDAVHAGDLGDLTLGAVTMPYFRPDRYYAQAAWRGTWTLDGGGVLMNQGIHIVDLLVWFMGDPVEVRAYAGTLHRQIEVEDTLAATLRFANGAEATIAATTTTAPGFPHRIEIYGTAGAIQIEGDEVHLWTLTDPALAKVTPIESTAKESVAPGTAGDPRGMTAAGHSAVMHEFIQSVRSGQDPPIDGKQGRRSLATILAIYEAAGPLPHGRH